MEHLAGLTLVKKNKDEVPADEALSNKEIIALYFSAHSDPYCREFNPYFADFYEKIKDQELPLEIIFVSSDETEEEFFSHMNESHGDWFAVPFGSPVIEKLRGKIWNGIPAVLVIKKDGTVVRENGMNDVYEKEVDAFKDWSNSGIMELLAEQTLVKKNKDQVPADEALSDKEIIAFYFSAHWCAPCREFTPILADFYEEIKDQELPLEIIFVSSDETEEELFSYMNESHGDWFAVPFGSPLIEELGKRNGTSVIPTLLVIKKDGSIVTIYGRDAVEQKGVAAFKGWSK